MEHVEHVIWLRTAFEEGEECELIAWDAPSASPSVRRRVSRLRGVLLAAFGLMREVAGSPARAATFDWMDDLGGTATIFLLHFPGSVLAVIANGVDESVKSLKSVCSPLLDGLFAIWGEALFVDARTTLEHSTSKYRLLQVLSFATRRARAGVHPFNLSPLPMSKVSSFWLVMATTELAMIEAACVEAISSAAASAADARGDVRLLRRSPVLAHVSSAVVATRSGRGGEDISGDDRVQPRIVLVRRGIAADSGGGGDDAIGSALCAALDAADVGVGGDDGRSHEAPVVEYAASAWLLVRGGELSAADQGGTPATVAGTAAPYLSPAAALPLLRSAQLSQVDGVVSSAPIASLALQRCHILRVRLDEAHVHMDRKRMQSAGAEVQRGDSATVAVHAVLVLAADAGPLTEGGRAPASARPTDTDSDAVDGSLESVLQAVRSAAAVLSTARSVGSPGVSSGNPGLAAAAAACFT